VIFLESPVRLRWPLAALAAALLALPLLPLFAGTPDEAPPPTEADLRFAEGVAALKSKDATAAEAALTACTALAPARVDCWWELGWARYLRSDWDGVMAAWAQVERLEPGHPGVASQTSTVKGKLAIEALLRQWSGEAPPPRPKPTGTVRLRAVGDVMMGSDFPEPWMPEQDGATYFADVAAALGDAELTFVNLEGPLCDGGSTNKCKEGSMCYAFRTPTRYGKLLQDVGVDLASTANNHAFDFGETCRAQTESTLTQLGIAWSGRHGTVAVKQVNGLSVAMIGFHSSDSAHNLNDQKTAVALVSGLAARHDLVIVSFHGGAEGSKAVHVPNGPESFYGEDRGDLRRFTHAVIDAGADLVLGHGPHVLRGLEVYNDRLIAYSLGNFATFGRFNLKGALGVGVILEVELDATGKFLGGQVIPTMQVGDGVPMMDPERRAVTQMSSLSAEDFGARAAQVSADGVIRAP
jgi:hypothetical protein